MLRCRRIKRVPRALAATTVAGQACLCCDAFSKFFLCTASAPCGRCLQRQGARWPKQSLLLSQRHWSGSSVPVSVCSEFITAVASASPACVWGGCRTLLDPSVWGGGRGVWEVSSFPPAKSCLPDLVPEEPSFPNFRAHQEQGNPVVVGGEMEGRGQSIPAQAGS